MHQGGLQWCAVFIANFGLFLHHISSDSNPGLTLKEPSRLRDRDVLRSCLYQRKEKINKKPDFGRSYRHLYIYIYIYWQHFFINAYLIEYNSHFLSMYIFVNPFELPYWSYDIRRELVDKSSIISYFTSTFCQTLGHKQSDGEVPVMLGLLGMRSTPLLPSLLGPLWPGVVAPDRVLYMS